MLLSTLTNKYNTPTGVLEVIVPVLEGLVCVKLGRHNQTMSRVRPGPPPRRTENDTSVTASSTVAPSAWAIALAVEMEARFLATINQVLSDEAVVEAIKSSGIKKSDLVQKMLAAKPLAPTAPANKKSATSVVTMEQLNAIIRKYDDKYQNNGCLVNSTYRKVDDRDPYTYCQNKALKDHVCAECTKKSVGKTLLKETTKRGFSPKSYRDKMREKAISWATNKKKQLSKGEDAADRIKYEANDSSEADEEDAPPAEEEGTQAEWVPYEHNMDLDYHQEWGLVAEVDEHGERTVIGIDFDNTGEKSGISEKEASKFEKMGIVIAAEAILSDDQGIDAAGEPQEDE